MHEFREVQSMLHEACAQAGPGVRIRNLTVALGEASGHDADHLRTHFVEAARGTPAEDAELIVVREALAAQCTRCGAEYSSSESTLSCVHCGGIELNVTKGARVYLAGVEMESEPRRT